MTSLLALSSLCVRFGRRLFSSRAVGRAAALAVLLAGLTSAGQAQTLLVSNLSDSIGESVGVYYNDGGSSVRSFAGSFTVGSTGAYLTGMSLKIRSGSGSGFSIGLYNNVSAAPGVLIEGLSGESSPTARGTYSYAATGTTFLSAGTTYWWVASVSGPDDGNFNVSPDAGDEFTGASGWSIGSTPLSQVNGGAWNSGGVDFPMMFSVTGSYNAPVPEPSTYAAIAGGAMLGVAAWRRRKGRAGAA